MTEAMSKLRAAVMMHAYKLARRLVERTCKHQGIKDLSDEDATIAAVRFTDALRDAAHRLYEKFGPAAP